MTVPSIMRFEGPLYPDGSGPKITVEYQAKCLGNDPGVRIKTFSDVEVVVFATELPWLIDTLTRIQRERNAA